MGQRFRESCIGWLSDLFLQEQAYGFHQCYTKAEFRWLLKSIAKGRKGLGELSGVGFRTGFGGCNR